MKKKKNETIIRYRKPVHINIGIIVFAFVLIYFLVYLINFLTDKHISIYEVQKGQIMKTTYYTGLVLRSENVTYSDISGNINYYKKESDKAGYSDLICSIDTDGSISQEITAAGLDGTALSKEELSGIQGIINDYTASQSDIQFYNVYSFKENVNANVQENLYQSALNQLTEQTDSAISNNTFSFVRASDDGILAFYTDGYEDVTPDSFTADMYNPSSYIKNNLKSNLAVSSGQALYKTITDENWYILIPLNAEQVQQYQQEMDDGSDSFIINVIFKKDNCRSYATASLKNYDGQDFIQLNLNSSMIRYISDRYLEVELGSADHEGLKIPNSAVTSKDFLLIPEDYISQGDNSSSRGVLKVDPDKKGDNSVEFVSTDIYYTDSETGFCYVNAADIQPGDQIQKPDSSDRYEVSETGTKEGVYNMNKGYAVFRIIEPITSNEEYTIIQTGTRYGLALYDRIALDGSAVSEGEFAN